MIEWISVEERLPEDNQTCIVFSDCGLHEAVFWGAYKRGKHTGDSFDFPDCNQEMTGRYEGVTHWMPMPTPPKKIRK